MPEPNEKELIEAKVLTYDTQTGGGRPHTTIIKITAIRFAELRTEKEEAVKQAYMMVITLIQWQFCNICPVRNSKSECLSPDVCPQARCIEEIRKLAANK